MCILCNGQNNAQQSTIHQGWSSSRQVHSILVGHSVERARMQWCGAEMLFCTNCSCRLLLLLSLVIFSLCCGSENLLVQQNVSTPTTVHSSYSCAHVCTWIAFVDTKLWTCVCTWSSQATISGIKWNDEVQLMYRCRSCDSKEAQTEDLIQRAAWCMVQSFHVDIVIV